MPKSYRCGCAPASCARLTCCARRPIRLFLGVALGGTAGGTLNVIGNLTGTGSVQFDLNASTGGADPTPATLVLNDVSAGQTITLNDANDVLVLATPAAFAGTIDRRPSPIIFAEWVAIA